jgi:hypothetical protein
MNSEQIFLNAVKDCKKLITRDFLTQQIKKDKTNTLKKYLKNFGITQLGFRLREIGQNLEPPKFLEMHISDYKDPNQKKSQFPPRSSKDYDKELFSLPERLSPKERLERSVIKKEAAARLRKVREERKLKTPEYYFNEIIGLTNRPYSYTSKPFVFRSSPKRSSSPIPLDKSIVDTTADEIIQQLNTQPPLDIESPSQEITEYTGEFYDEKIDGDF